MNARRGEPRISFSESREEAPGVSEDRGGMVCRKRGWEGIEWDGKGEDGR